ncbi:MAG: LysE family transporter, partial [Campylobacter sp.]|nr:LysE family transporter [Campylobacter sp.]
FWLGSVLASFIWFFSLGYGAMKLSKLFMNAKAWRIIDFVVGIFMFYIAFLLIRFILKI